MANQPADVRVIVLHGAHGGPDTNWFPWLHAELENRGIEVIRPTFPTPEGQSLSAWMTVYDETIKSLPEKPTILVGHSLGSAMTLRVVEQATKPFVGTFITSAFVGALGLPDYDPINQSFFDDPFDWAGICARKGAAHGSWAGDDDPYVPLERSQQVADLLQTSLEVIPGGGHLNRETGFNAFPQVRDAILSACQQA
ncbi:RBBP9/YdeN family alpha/beta hydrolase [Thalassospira marina]|uniref:Alpha/beta hydrolase n=1 Tax=Thalassospira marina TaxID=2048283 RepID=A0ABM6Q973_9PROT|nr:alpha/beta fold hydrolase [Thalassospira marina]AUG52727.1 hypothetical protein CSC3H3_08415 [Thalassospira marina]